MRHLVLFFTSGLYTGYIPFASGTWGTALAILFYLPMAQWNRLPSEGGKPWLYLGVTIAVTALAVWGSNYAEKVYKEKDPGKVVIDEIAGFFFAMFLLPTTAIWIVAAFFVFRAMDVWKPGPIRNSQNLGGGVGIVIDDVLAGILTCVILHAVRLGLSAL